MTMINTSNYPSCKQLIQMKGRKANKNVPRNKIRSQHKNSKRNKTEKEINEKGLPKFDKRTTNHRGLLSSSDSLKPSKPQTKAVVITPSPPTPNTSTTKTTKASGAIEITIQTKQIYPNSDTNLWETTTICSQTNLEKKARGTPANFSTTLSICLSGLCWRL